MDHDKLLGALRQVEKLITWAHTGKKPTSDSIELGMVHEGLLFAYGELDEDGMPLRSVKTSTRGLYRLVTGAMRELSELGIQGLDLTSVKSAVESWRDTYFVKAMDHYDSLEELREAMPYCWACFDASDQDGLVFAHITSRGADTSMVDVPENQLLLCNHCHIETQHKHGWDLLVQKHPHIYPRINKAIELARKATR